MPEVHRWGEVDQATPKPRQCADGLVHYVVYTKQVKGRDEPGMWMRICDYNDDGVRVTTLPLSRESVTCVACVAKEPPELMNVVELHVTV